VVRAVGRIVVWVDAAADVSTMRMRRSERKVPEPTATEHCLAEHG
jgi:hypothetical protein